MIAMNRQNVDAAGETYGDVQKLIAHMARQFAGKHGGNVDDYESAADEAFVRAYASYDPARGAFTTYLWWSVRHAMIGVNHRSAMDRRTVDTGADIDLDLLPGRSGFDLKRWAEELSVDAHRVVHIALETSESLSDAMHHEDAPGAVRGGLCRRLRGLGWSVARIVESFDEIRRALG